MTSHAPGATPPPGPKPTPTPGPRPAPPAGSAGVDLEVLKAQVEGLDALPTTEHAEVFTSLHAQLTETLRTTER